MIGLFLAVLLGFAVRWLLRQRGRQATIAGKASIVLVLVSCLSILALEDIKRVPRVAKERVAARLKQAGRRS